MSASRSGHGRALKHTSPLDMEVDSDTSSESEELEETGQQLDAAKSSFISMWREAFDASKLPQQISVALFKRAPFLLGSDHARYTIEFFKHTGGLCARGYKFKELASDDLFPLANLVSTYPTSRKGNRHPLKLIAEKETARDALHMYQRVYGGTQPDNGEFGTSFIRGLALYFQKNKDVNWAERARDLAVGRMKSPGKNPMKLTPPCLREQIQAMIDLFAHYLLDAYKRLNAAASTSNAGGPQRFPLPQPPIVAEREAMTPPAPKPSPMKALHARQRAAEGRLNSLLKLTEAVKIEAANQEKLLLQYIAAEEECWDQHHELRQRAKVVVGNDAEKASLNDVVRAKVHEVTAASATVESTKLLLSKSKSDLNDREVKLEKLKLEIERMKADMSVLLIESSRIQPQSFSSLLPAEATDLSNLMISDPCASCQKFFSHSALVPFSCGCLFHPHCMFKTALLENVVCPRCLQAPSEVWMVQWGFASSTETMLASISASKNTSRALGWEPEKEISGSSSKRLQDAGNSAFSDRAKRMCGSSLPAPEIPETLEETVVSAERTVSEVITDVCNSVDLAADASNVQEPAVAHVAATVEAMDDVVHHASQSTCL